MFDLKTGETVHVDFDCLFEKGESFDWPEKVPFRLTHNLVDAFGVTGVEGTFRYNNHKTHVSFAQFSNLFRLQQRSFGIHVMVLMSMSWKVPLLSMV